MWLLHFQSKFWVQRGRVLTPPHVDLKVLQEKKLSYHASCSKRISLYPGTPGDINHAPCQGLLTWRESIEKRDGGRGGWNRFIRMRRPSCVPHSSAAGLTKTTCERGIFCFVIYNTICLCLRQLEDSPFLNDPNGHCGKTY